MVVHIAGKQKYACKECSRQFVLDPTNCVSQDNLIDKLLLEKISLAGIARVIGVSERWLQKYVNEKYDLILKFINVIGKKKVTSHYPQVNQKKVYNSNYENAKTITAKNKR